MRYYENWKIQFYNACINVTLNMVWFDSSYGLILWKYRSSHSEVFWRKGVPKKRATSESSIVGIAFSESKWKYKRLSINSGHINYH